MSPRGEPFCDTLEASAASFARKMNLDYTEQRCEIVKETPQPFSRPTPGPCGRDITLPAARLESPHGGFAVHLIGNAAGGSRRYVVFLGTICEPVLGPPPT
jgi:hypothetical protein